MVSLLFLWFGTLVHIFRRHRSLVLENLALRQQLAVLKRRHPRSRLGKRMKPTDKAILGMVSKSQGRNASEPRSGLETK